MKDQSLRVISELPVKKEMNHHQGGRKEEAITVHENVLC